MSQKSTSRPAKVERFIQTQEDFQELGEYLTSIPSVQSVASSKIQRSSKSKKLNKAPGQSKVDHGGDHYDSTVVSDTKTFAELNKCPSTIYIKLGSKSLSQLHAKSKGAVEKSSSSCFPCTDPCKREADECGHNSQDSLSMSEQECVPCDQGVQVNDCMDNRSRPLSVKPSCSMTASKKSKYKSGVVSKSSVSSGQVSSQKLIVKDGLVISQTDIPGGATLTEITRAELKKAPFEMASGSNLEPRSHRQPDKIRRILRHTASDSDVANYMRVQNQLDLNVIRSESRLALQASLTKMMKPGIGGLKEFISVRQFAAIKEEEQPQLTSFITHFVKCDGLRYLGILEQIELDFEARCKAGLLHAKPNNDMRSTFLRRKLAEIAEVQPVYQQKNLKRFNFPQRLLNEIKNFPVNYQPKLDLIKKIHDYGSRMEDYWYKELEMGKEVNPTEIYDIATQILAELMSQVFSILVKLCEHLVIVNQEARKYKKKYTLEILISVFTHIRMLTVDEVGAVGESCGEVMMRITRLNKDVIYDLMTKLYSQINFVDICICRALRAVVPLILHYDIQLNRQSQ